MNGKEGQSQQQPHKHPNGLGPRPRVAAAGGHSSTDLDGMVDDAMMDFIHGLSPQDRLQVAGPNLGSGGPSPPFAHAPPRLSDFGMIPAPSFIQNRGAPRARTDASSPTSTASSPHDPRRPPSRSTRQGSSSLSPDPVFQLDHINSAAGTSVSSRSQASTHSHRSRHEDNMDAIPEERPKKRKSKSAGGTAAGGASAALAAAVALKTGDNTPHLSTEDEPFDFAAFHTIRPPVHGLQGLRLLLNGIRRKGAKSRVETQIKMSIAIVQPIKQGARPPPEDDFSNEYVRIGSYRAIRLPNSIGTKKKGKKLNVQPDVLVDSGQAAADAIRESEILDLVCEVYCLDTGEKAYACAKCVAREEKRAHARLVNRIRPITSDSEDGPRRSAANGQMLFGQTVDSMQVDEEGLTLADRNKIVLFNCSQTVELVDGCGEIPARVTCYCRHHREKTGYRITFRLFNMRGEVVAQGESPPIMITDDHKTTMATAPKSDSMSGVSASTSRSKRSKGVTREGSGSGDEKPTRKSKPYDRKPAPSSEARSSVSGAASPRSTFSAHGLSMTPLGGRSTPGSPLGANQSGSSYFGLPLPGGSGAITPGLLASANNMSITSPDQELSAISQRLSDWAQQRGGGGGGAHAHTRNFGGGREDVMMGPPYDALGLDQNMPPFHHPSAPAEPDFDSMLNLSPQASGEVNFPEDDLQRLLSHDLDPNNMWAHPAWNPPPPPPAAPRPTIARLVPNDGPTHGGIEVTILGENFSPTMVCTFGEFQAVTVQSYGPTTLVCMLPPSPIAGPVAVSIRDPQSAVTDPRPSGAIFTYRDTSDQKLMEMALTAVGLRVTGKVVGAVEIARRIMSAPQTGADSALGNGGASLSGGGQQQQQQQQQRGSEIAQAFKRYQNGDALDPQTSIIGFLRTFLFDSGRATQSRRGKIALNHVSQEGQSMLHVACLLGYDVLARFLVGADANPNIHDRNGYTALAFAAISGNVSCVRILLAAGARPLTVTFSNMTATQLARRAGQTGIAALLESILRKQSPSSRRRESTSSADADNPSSDDDTDSLESGVQDSAGALSPKRLTTPADVQRSRPHSLSTKSDGATTVRAVTPATEAPPPYAPSDAVNWLQRTLSHLPGTQMLPPATQLKEYIPPAVWDKLPSAQVLIPHMPEFAQRTGEMLDSSAWMHQAWLAVPMSAWLNLPEAQASKAATPQTANTATVPASATPATTGGSPRSSVRRDALTRKRSTKVKKYSTPTLAPAEATRAKVEIDKRLKGEFAAIGFTKLPNDISLLAADKMLFLFWLPVLLLAFAYTAVTTIPFALVRAVVGPVMRVVRP